MIGVTVTLIAGLLLAGYFGSWQIPNRAKTILYYGIGLRFLGAVAREQVAADALLYYSWGQLYAGYFSQFDFSPLYDPRLYRHEAWLGTNFVGYPVGLVITLIGESWLGTFFAFGLISFLGLVAFALAFNRCYGLEYRTYWGWIFLIPSLWFWPSSIGKECLMLTGLGVATLGYAGRRGQPNWVLLLLGLSLVFCIRPQVAAVFLCAVALSYALNFKKVNSQNLLQVALVVGVGMAGVWYSISTSLGGDANIEALEEYVAEGQRRSGQGGSEIESLGTGPAGLLMAPVNVLLRPFPWEAHNLASLVAAMEVLLIWGLVYWRRNELRMAMKVWRKDRMLRFAVPFTAMYVLAFGMMVANMGIIARQRVLVFPFFFLIIEAGANYLRVAELKRRKAKAVRAKRGYPIAPRLGPAPQ